MSGIGSIKILKEYWQDNVLNIVYVEEESMKSENKAKQKKEDVNRKPPVLKQQGQGDSSTGLPEDEFR